ncbi:MAG: hypothetical protein GXW85_12635 [Clostridia bacterium]|nr:hypothetical protein [Clostridia bacterium]
MPCQQFNQEMPFGEYAYPYGSNVNFGQTCPYCGSPLGIPYGWSGPETVSPFGGMFGPGMAEPYGGMFAPGMTYPYGNSPWWY